MYLFIHPTLTSGIVPCYKQCRSRRHIFNVFEQAAGSWTCCSL